MLETENVLVVPGSSFNVPYRNHFRITLLPEASQLAEVFQRIERVLDRAAEAASANTRERSDANGDVALCVPDRDVPLGTKLL